MTRAARTIASVVLTLAAACHAVGSSPPAVPVPPAIAAQVRLTRIASGLSKPVALTFAPGDASGRLFVVEKTGTVRIMRGGGVEPKSAPFLDLSTRVSRGSEQGLLGLAFHPRYRENRRLYVNLTDRNGDTRVLELRAAADDPDRVDPASERELLFVHQPYANHNGGNLVFGPDGLLYVGLGDGGSAGDPHRNGQNPKALLAKMLTVDVDARTPASPSVVALGLRNPWRYSFDRATGDLWIGDVGQNRFEEVDVLPAGNRTAATPTNFGWNVMEGLHCFGAPTCAPQAFTPPVVEYGHDDGCSITGGFVYRGARLPALVGLYFCADYCTAMIRSLRWNGPSEPVTELWDWRAALDPEERLANLSSFGEDAVGEIYLLSLDGAVYALVPSTPSRPAVSAPTG
jgi:glucose/arabinose dehydrogenase